MNPAFLGQRLTWRRWTRKLSLSLNLALLCFCHSEKLTGLFSSCMGALVVTQPRDSPKKKKNPFNVNLLPATCTLRVEHPNHKNYLLWEWESWR